MSSIDMNEMGELVRQAARAYLTEQGDVFEAHGVRLPLSIGVMEDAIGEHIANPLLTDEDEDCRAGLLPLLASMLSGDALSESGRALLDKLLSAICEDIKQLDDETGIDPLGYLPKRLRELGPRVIGGYRNQPLCPKREPDYQTLAPALACAMAQAFVAEQGPFYLSEGADGAPNLSLPLTPDNVTEAIRSAVMDGAAHGFGESFALHMLCRSLDGEALTDYGYGLIVSMLEEVCEAAREMLAEGRDPWAEIAKMQAEQTGRAGS